MHVSNLILETLSPGASHPVNRDDAQQIMFRIAWASLCTALMALTASGAHYPQKRIRLFIPFPPGGGTDVLARALSDKLTEALGASLVIDTRPGAGGTMGSGIVARSDPD